MSPTRRQPSYTLPRNFVFHLDDGEPPTTPTQASASIVPPRGHADVSRQLAPYRLRRRRDTRALQAEHFIAPRASDIPIPTIEVFNVSAQTDASQSATFSQSFRLRASPPRTPVPQIQDSEFDQEMNIHQSEASSQGESISRPSTACSGFSDSSISSSIESFPSLGESFTSPESEALDYHQYRDPAEKHIINQSVSSSQTAQILSSTHPKRKCNWTEDMDNHLWMTYMRYLQDPTHTPFKMLPGTAPPLGVCMRVAREARRTWKGTRPLTNHRVQQLMPLGQIVRGESPDTIKVAQSGSSTPTENQMPKRPQSWPRSDASTRRRLRDLCKNKPTLSAHYNRLLTCRSPSPFMSSPGSRSSSLARHIHPHATSVHSDHSFSTRDMSLSLFTTTSSAVNVMNQLTADSVTPKPFETGPFQSSNPRLGAHQKSQSLQLNLGIGGHNAGIDGILASPFQPIRTSNAGQEAQAENMHETPVAATPRLASPLNLHAPVPRSRVRLSQAILGNEASGLDSSPAQSLFPSFVRHPRGRSRAVSMGDVNAHSRRLSMLFQPPSVNKSSLQPQPCQAARTSSSSSSLLEPPILGSVRRLGSPFSERTSRPLFNTFPRNFPLHGLEPTMESQEERQAGPGFLNAT